MRFFNTTGPVVPTDHYCLPPLERLNFNEVRTLIQDKRYFALHAPRQTGKTSALFALRDLLNSGAEGDYRCVYINVEVGQAGREDVPRAMRAILNDLALQARLTLRDEFIADIRLRVLEEAGPDDAFKEVLSRWSQADPKPLVLLMDEIDALVGDTLLSVLRQLRAGYVLRPQGFPQSARSVRRARRARLPHPFGLSRRKSSPAAAPSTSRPSRCGSAISRTMTYCRCSHSIPRRPGRRSPRTPCSGCGRSRKGSRGSSTPSLPKPASAIRTGVTAPGSITADDIDEAQEQLIVRRETHLDQLADKLQEDRVRRVVGPLLSGGDEREFSARDLEYVRDLGLIARDDPLRIANPVYAEVVPRELTVAAQAGLGAGRRLVRRRRRGPRRGGAADRVPGVLPGALRALGAALRLPGSGAAAPAAGVPAAHRQRRRPHRAGIRARPGAHRPARHVATGRANPEVRDRVQDFAQEPGTNHPGGSGTNRGIHGPLRGRIRTSRHLRPRRRPVGGQGVLSIANRVGETEVQVWGM